MSWKLPGELQIMAERNRQRGEKGFGKRHDLQHIPGTLARAGICYALYAEWQLNHEESTSSPPNIIENLWPRGWQFKPDKNNPIRNLVKAGALMAAEIDRNHNRLFR